ncbi:Unknown protein [Striga hermonthica]|uniref:Transposase n=1 Tax=Striga hermonthica TaxID=68872 RepID=A0A9N7RQ02_STRHE|nr:Unknown protein [Striga hermonthica]
MVVIASMRTLDGWLAAHWMQQEDTEPLASRQIHKGDRIEHEPFVSADQVDQVFYVDDDYNNPGWSVALKMKPKDDFEMGEEWNDVECEPYHRLTGVERVKITWEPPPDFGTAETYRRGRAHMPKETVSSRLGLPGRLLAQRFDRCLRERELCNHTLVFYWCNISIGLIVHCDTMVEDMWTINLLCDGADKGEKRVQKKMDRDEICYFNLMEMIEHYGYTSVDYIYYRRKDGLVAIEQDPQVMKMLEECESQKMVSLFVTKQRLATLAPTNSNKEPSKSQPNKTKVKVPGARASVAVARGRRKQIIQSHDEYLSEEHIGQESHGQTTEASELHSSARGDQIDGDGDIEVNFHDESEDRVKRGKTKLKDIWNLPKGHRIVVRCNELDQPIGVEAEFLGKFLGMVARNGCLCSLSYKDWRLFIGKKEKNTDEQKNKKDILKQVKMRFLYHSRMEKWILRTTGERWRQHKSNLKSIYFDEHKSTKENHIVMFLTVYMREKDPEKKNPHRAVLYLHTHQTKSEDTNAHVEALKELIEQQPCLAETSQGKVAWKGDALSKILGEERHGHVHGLGLVPNPNQVFGACASKRLKSVHLTSLDETSSEDVVDGDPVYASKDGYCADVPNMKRMRVYSDPQNQDSSMDGPLNDTMNEHANNVEDDDLQLDYENLSHVHKRQKLMMQRKIDVLSSKKQKVVEHSYGTTNLDSSTPATINISLQMEQDDYVENEDLTAHYKDSCSNDKVISKETYATPSNFEASQYQMNKISKRPSASVPASKNHRGTTSLSTGNTMKVGTKVYLQRWKNRNKNVAMGKLVSCDPKQKLDGVQLGKEFWMVSVSFVMVEDEPLIRPYKNYKVLRDVEGGVHVAWPSTLIEKIDI